MKNRKLSIRKLTRAERKGSEGRRKKEEATGNRSGKPRRTEKKQRNGAKAKGITAEERRSDGKPEWKA